MKGVYKIADPMVNFFFRFIYPYESDIVLMKTSGVETSKKNYFNYKFASSILFCYSELVLRPYDKNKWEELYD